MSTEQIWEIGQQRLAKIEPETEGINTWKAHLTNYLPSTEYPDDAYAWLTCTLALDLNSHDIVRVRAITTSCAL